MPNNPNAVTNVIVSVHVVSSNPILPIVLVEEVIKNGSGTLMETIFGGQVSLRLQLTAGEQVRALKLGELVYARGLRNGAPFVINNPMTTDKTSDPWEFSRTSGTTGP